MKGRCSTRQTCPHSRLPKESDELDRADCPELKLIAPSEALKAAVRDFITRRQGQIAHQRKSQVFTEKYGVTLYKWELMALGNRYDAILFSDLDVDLLPRDIRVPAVRADWESMLPSLLERKSTPSHANGEYMQGVRLISNPDWSSPVNAGLMLMMPPAHKGFFRSGLEVLYTPFNDTHGFNLSGTPLQLLGTRKLQMADGSVFMYAGAPAIIDNPKWDFVGADVDQGFFLYMFHIHQNVGLFPRTRSPYFVRHFWGGGPKPWQIVLGGDRSLRPDRALCSNEHLQMFDYLHDLPLGDMQAASQHTSRLQLLQEKPDGTSRRNESHCLAAFRNAFLEMEAANIGCCQSLKKSRHEQRYNAAQFHPF
mmetsp:Transcript_51852/g.116420  ORF Transcript_51852/g.116420 Transcript_51852/m.116420 type:complete len:366 (-) Transcript_51852:101-1198(-)